jgi:hydrogenase expression/formation protein HypC
MCLGVPGRVVEVAGTVALVDFSGVRRKVALDIVDEPVGPGDHVLVHVGFAIRRIAPEDLEETLAFFAAMTADDDTEGPRS